MLGYDLRQQVSLFERLSQRDGGAADAFRTPSGKRLLLLTVAVLLIAISVWWLRRRRKRKRDAEQTDPRKRSREEAMAVGLYQSLDRAMVALGIARSAATPPLRHAVALRRVGHPCSDEIFELTVRYLAARFGDDPLEVDERREFENRVRVLRESAKSGVLQRAASALERDGSEQTASPSIDAAIAPTPKNEARKDAAPKASARADRTPAPDPPRREPASERTPLIEVVEIEMDISDLLDDELVDHDDNPA